MREPEGIETPPPGKSSERTWSKHREPHFRNVVLPEFEWVGIPVESSVARLEEVMFASTP